MPGEKQYLTPRINSRSKNHRDPKDEKLDTPPCCSNGSAKCPLKIHQNENGPDQQQTIQNFPRRPKTEPPTRRGLIVGQKLKQVLAKPKRPRYREERTDNDQETPFSEKLDVIAA